MLGVRLDADTERGLLAIVQQTGRPKSQIVRDAIRAYVVRHDRDARARHEWAEISRAERDDREIAAILDAGVTDFGKGD